MLLMVVPVLLLVRPLALAVPVRAVSMASLAIRVLKMLPMRVMIGFSVMFVALAIGMDMNIRRLVVPDVTGRRA